MSIFAIFGCPYSYWFLYRYYTRMLDLIKNSSADSQQLLAQVGAACEYRPPFFSASCALLCDSPQIVPVPVVMHEVKKYCRTL